jgi:DNA-binding transcriptional LysR family regulator
VELSHLRYFRVLGRLQHVTRAAEALGIAQPTLSRAISRLERELGVPLMHPAGRSVKLSAVGVVLHDFVDRALGELDRGFARVSEMAVAEDNTVALGLLRSLATQFVPDLTRRFRLRHPAARFVLTEGGRENLISLLQEGLINLCITEPAGDSRFEWHTLAQQSFVVIVPRTHRLARRKCIALTELADDSFATFKEGYRSRAKIDALLKAAGVKPKIISESDESDSVRAIVAAGSAVAIVPDSGAKGEVVTLAIEDPVAVREVGVMWVPGRRLSAAELTFRSFLIEHASTPVPAFGPSVLS